LQQALETDTITGGVQDSVIEVSGTPDKAAQEMPQPLLLKFLSDF
jgi:hypothetical protein